MNKFQKLISGNGNDVLARRAGSIATAAEVAQQNIVNQLKQEKSRIELEIINLTDLAPETSDSLRPGNKDWDAKDWALKLQEAKENLYNITIQLNIAEETYKEYFKDE